MHIAMTPIEDAFVFRAAMANNRLIVGALGFSAFLALQMEKNPLRLAGMFAGAAVFFAGLVAARYAGTSPAASLLAVVIAIIASAIVAAWPGDAKKPERIIYACVVMVGCLALTNFLAFQNWGYTGTNRAPPATRFTAINYNDMFHYFLGTKYASELSYTRLYVCFAAVGKDLGYLDAGQQARDLQTNKMVTVGSLLRHRAECRAHFTSKQWQSFKADAATFLRAAVGRPGVRYLTDFGYNATPFWEILNRPFVAWTKATPANLGALAMIDGVLFLVCTAFLVWAFGSQAAALVLLTWGVGVMWVMNHVGIPCSFGRFWWFTALTAAVCLAERHFYRSAGVALAASTALCAFPGVFLFWPALVAARQLLRRQALSAEIRQLLAGALGGGLVFGLLSMIGVANPIHQYIAFVRNSTRIMAGFIVNNLGLQPLLHTAPDSVIWVLPATGLFWLVYATCRKLPLVPALLLFGLFSAFILLPMANYYYVALALLAPFMLSRSGSSAGADLPVYAVFVFLGNIVFITDPFHEMFIYRASSFLLAAFLCYFAVRWYRMNSPVPAPSTP